LLNDLERSHKETEREQTLDISREMIKKERADTNRRRQEKRLERELNINNKMEIIREEKELMY